MWALRPSFLIKSPFFLTQAKMGHHPAWVRKGILIFVGPARWSKESFAEVLIKIWILNLYMVYPKIYSLPSPTKALARYRKVNPSLMVIWAYQKIKLRFRKLALKFWQETHIRATRKCMCNLLEPMRWERYMLQILFGYRDRTHRIGFRKSRIYFRIGHIWV